MPTEPDEEQPDPVIEAVRAEKAEVQAIRDWSPNPIYDALVIEHQDQYGREPLEPWERTTGLATDEMAAVAVGSSHVREILADDGDGVLQTCTGCPDWEDESPDRDIADAMWAQHIEGEQHADPVA